MSPRKNFTTDEEESGVAVIYARFSTHNQREASIEQQIQWGREHARKLNLTIVEVYQDKAISGKTDRRPDFQRMMRDAEKGKFRYVIAWKSNRMGRNMLQAMLNEARLNEFGIRCLYVEENFDDTAAGRFALRNMMNVNQFYSENMAEDIMRGLLDNAQKCMVNNGGLPLGYKRGDDGRYAIIEEEAEIVREIFERVLADDTFVDIANDLNARGIKTSRGNRWNKGSFHSMLRNERYIGIYEYANIRIEDGVPPIIGKELFYSVQKKLRTKKHPIGRHRENGDYLLTGKLYCGHCGSFMVGMSGTSKTEAKHYYYVCKKRREDKSCKKKTVRRDWIEQKIAETVKENIMRDDVITWIADGYDAFMKANRKDSALLAAKEELSATEKAIKNVMAAIEAGIFTPSTKERLIELEHQKATLQMTVSIEQAAQQEVSKEQIEFWLESFRDGSVKSKKYQAKLIDAFVQAVYLYDDELRIVFNYCGKNDSVSLSFADVDNVEKTTTPESSFKLPLCPPEGSQTNSATIYLMVSAFVLVLPI